MPRNTREWAHVKLSQIDNLLDTCLMYLEEIHGTYNEAHPEVSEPINAAQTVLLEVQSLLNRLSSSF